MRYIGFIPAHRERASAVMDIRGDELWMMNVAAYAQVVSAGPQVGRGEPLAPGIAIKNATTDFVVKREDLDLRVASDGVGGSATKLIALTLRVSEEGDEPDHRPAKIDSQPPLIRRVSHSGSTHPRHQRRDSILRRYRVVVPAHEVQAFAVAGDPLEALDQEVGDPDVAKGAERVLRVA